MPEHEGTSLFPRQKRQFREFFRHRGRNDTFVECVPYKFHKIELNCFARKRERINPA